MTLQVRTLTAGTRVELEVKVEDARRRGWLPVAHPHPVLFDGKPGQDRPAWAQSIERRT